MSSGESEAKIQIPILLLTFLVEVSNSGGCVLLNSLTKSIIVELCQHCFKRFVSQNIWSLHKPCTSSWNYQ